MINLVKDTKGTEVPKLYAHDSAIFKRIDAGTVRYYGIKGEEIPVTREDILDAIISSLDRIQKVIDLLPEKEYERSGIIIEEMINACRIRMMGIFNYVELLYGRIEITRCEDRYRNERVVDVLLIENEKKTVKREKA